MFQIILSVLLDILSGFTLYSILFICFVLVFKSKKKESIIQFDNSAKKTVVILGLIYILLFPIYYFVEIGNLTSRNPVIYKYFQLTPFVLILFTQLLWIKKLNKNWIVRVLIMICVSFDIERYVIFITSLHRDYLPATWSMNDESLLLNPLKNCFYFISITTIIFLVNNYKKNVN